MVSQFRTVLVPVLRGVTVVVLVPGHRLSVYFKVPSAVPMKTAHLSLVRIPMAESFLKRQCIISPKRQCIWGILVIFPDLRLSLNSRQVWGPYFTSVGAGFWYPGCCLATCSRQMATCTSEQVKTNELKANGHDCMLHERSSAS